MPENPAKAAKRLDELTTARTLIPLHFLNLEPQLMMMKWFEYRFLSPMAATMLFAELYKEGLRSYLRTNIDYRLADTVKGVRTGIPSEPTRQFTQLWRARQRADELFVPYDLFIEFGFEFVSRRKRRWTPLPLQLHASERNEEAWWWKFLPFVEDRLPTRIRRLTQLPQYRLEHFQDLPPQRQFREIMASEIRYGTRPWADHIGETCLARRQLPLRVGLALIDRDRRRDTLASIRRDLGSWQFAPVENLDDEDLLPSCFGIGEAIDEPSAACSICPLSVRCTQFAASVIDETRHRTGAMSPLQIHARAKNAERVRRHRARKRAIAAETAIIEAAISET